MDICKKNERRQHDEEENVHLDFLYIRHRVCEQRIGTDGKGNEGNGKEFHCSGSVAIASYIVIEVFFSVLLCIDNLVSNERIL